MGALPHNIKPTPSTSKVDLVLLCLVLALGLFSARAFYLRQSATNSPALQATAEKGGRSLASLSPADGQAKERSTRVLELGCLDEKPARLTTEAGLLRLVAESCAGATATEARNETTGEKLMLFQREKKFSTHYFPLKSGSNKIVIEWKSGAKKGVAKILEVERSGGQL